MADDAPLARDVLDESLSDPYKSTMWGSPHEIIEGRFGAPALIIVVSDIDWYGTS